LKNLFSKSRLQQSHWFNPQKALQLGRMSEPNVVDVHLTKVIAKAARTLATDDEFFLEFPTPRTSPVMLSQASHL
jgi:hypothetical protein